MREISIPLRMRMQGRYKFKMTRESDGRVRETPWFDNLITNNGLNGIGTKTMTGVCYVGTGSTTPSNTDTALASYLASTTNVTSNTPSSAASAPYYWQNVIVYRFAAGTATGNLSEVGIAPSGTPPQALFSRALILDGDGNPTTITVLSDEILDVTYEVRSYFPVDDWTGTVTIDGDSYDVTVRASSVTNSFTSGLGPGSRVLPTSSVTATNGSIGAVTAAPSGTTIASAGPVADAYSNNSNVLQMHWTFPVDTSGDVSAARWVTTYGAFQIGFDPPIPKLTTQTLFMKVQVAWARKDLS